MAKSAMIRARTEPDLKKSVEQIFKKLGLSTTEAINMFYHQVKMRKGIPFEVKIPNKITEQTFIDTDMGKNVTKCKNAKDLFEKLNS